MSIGSRDGKYHFFDGEIHFEMKSGTFSQKDIDGRVEEKTAGEVDIQKNKMEKALKVEERVQSLEDELQKVKEQVVSSTGKMFEEQEKLEQKISIQMGQVQELRREMN